MVILDGSKLQSELLVNENTSLAAVRILDFPGVVAALDRYGGRDYVERFLSVVESAAKARNDLRLANDARYERRKRIAEEYSPPRHLADYVFYRGISGYLVRPWHPLVTLAAIAFACAVARRYRAGRVWGPLYRSRLAARLHPVRTAGAEVASPATPSAGSGSS